MNWRGSFNGCNFINSTGGDGELLDKCFGTNHCFTDATVPYCECGKRQILPGKETKIIEVATRLIQ